MLAGEIEIIMAWSEVIDDSTYYELLGILEIADEEAIKIAYREFARAFHPDTHPDADVEVSATLRRIFQRGVEAYRTLSDPALRAEYDLALARGVLRLKDSRLPPAAQGGARSLEDLCETMSAKMAARRAEQLITAGELAEAKRQLQMAVYHEGGHNERLVERLDALDLMLFAKGQ